MPDTPTPAPIEEILPVMRAGNRFVLTTHVNPDGDGLGSELALADALTRLGKSVDIINHSATPEVYRFLDHEQRIAQFNPATHAAQIANADVIVVLDTNQRGRLRTMEGPVLASPATRVCIDHHLDPDGFADYYVIDEEATSTGEIIYSLIVALLGRSLPAGIARSLYCAIMTDTGSFRYPRVDADVHRLVAHLIECGADPVAMYSGVYEQWSSGRVHLLGEMLAGLQTTANGRLAYVTITQDMLRRTGTTEEDTDNFTTYPMSLEGVVVGILFLELKNGCKISFRSKGEVPINLLAKEFGGNGHKNAAGARVYVGGLPEIQDRVLRAASQYL